MEENDFYQSSDPGDLSIKISSILMSLITDLKTSSKMYDKIFESIFKIAFTTTSFKQLEKLVAKP